VKPAVRRCVLVSIPTLAILLAGCNVQDKTQWFGPRYDGVPAEAGDIGLRNVVVVTSADGQATVLTTFANRGGADELLEVRIGESAATPTDGPLQIPAGGYAALGPEAAQVDVTGVDLVPGLLTEVEFLFADSPRTTVDAVVKEAEGRYADVHFSEPAVDVAEEPDLDTDEDESDDEDTDAGTEDGADDE
jgi:hypothetical protein